MQETGKLVVGIDLCDDITQVTVMRPHAAEPDAVCFDARTRKEYLPTLLCENPDGTRSIEEAVPAGVRLLPPFFRAAINAEDVSFRGTTYTGRELLECYVSLLIKKIRERFEGQEIGFVAVTCEEANTKESARILLSKLFEEQEGFSGKCLVLSHLEAYLHFVIRQEEALWQNGSAVFDYATEGLLFYHMECRRVDGKRLFVADYKDYSEEIPSGFIGKEDTEQKSLTFERLAGTALQQKVASLFVTGRGFEGDWVSDVLRLLSNGRRVFRGQNLYTQGACYAGAEVFRQERNADFSLLTPEQITVDAVLSADSIAHEDGVLLVSAGTSYKEAKAEVELILDATDKLSFKLIPAGETTPRLIRVAPNLPELRGDRTSRYQLRVFFVKRDVMVIQLKETGFGVFYPPTDRIYEEIVDFSHFEQ